ncbi:carbohydrate ABC transporter permease [Paenibacillus sp. GXUN7292]|uniref:carbohydrate ABC transporter permease n=1 Tax=Paenibacillus sp. GXUN7292 TaxID=3422499 RepID=UPI003D7CFD31
MNSRIRRNDYFWAYMMIAPTSIGLLIFYIWPLFQSVYFSMTKWGDFGKYEWTGLDNYKRLIEDSELWLALKNTVVYTVLTVPASIIISTVIAVLLARKVKGLPVYRMLYFLPVVTMPSAIAMVWRWLYHADFGIINYMLGFLSMDKIRWLTDPDLALYSVIIVAVWSSIGTNMILLLSGLQGISSQYYEAASIDGASAFSQFTKITVPLLTPTLFFVSVMSLISAFQVFDLIFMMLPQSAALESAQTVVYLYYKYAFMTGDKGYATTIAMLLFVIIMLVTYVQLKLQKNWVHYQ